ncbi:MAG TPA: Ig-like domain-containing protein, partial [Candidatus Brocadiia bacterium]|nr:Ig-like domain-containing protein [Candidatus Brocadiia bacterium]
MADNTINNSATYGILMTGPSADVTISENLIGGAHLKGISLQNVGAAVIQWNAIIGSSEVGIEMAGASAMSSIEGNLIFGCGTDPGADHAGILLNSVTGPLSIMENAIACNANGIVSGVLGDSNSYSTGVTAMWNAMAGNAGYGVLNRYDNPSITTDRIDARGNWWNSSDGPNGVGPGRGDAVSANVRYLPWLSGNSLVELNPVDDLGGGVTENPNASVISSGLAPDEAVIVYNANALEGMKNSDALGDFIFAFGIDGGSELVEGNNHIAMLQWDTVNHTAYYDDVDITYISIPPTVDIDLQAASDTGDSDTDNLTADNTPTFDVTVNKGGLIEIDYNGDSVIDASLSVADAGVYQFTPSPALIDGAYPVNVSFTDSYSREATDSDPVTVDTVTGVTIDLQAGSDTGASNTDNITADNAPTFDVTVAEAGVIEVDYDGDSVIDETLPVVAGGTYTFTSATLTDATYPADVTFTDVAGNTATDSDPVTVDTVTGVTIDLQAGSDTGASNTDNITADNAPTFDVTVAEAGLIEVDYDGDSVMDETLPVLAGGTYTFTSAALTDATYPADVTFTDVAGNTATDSDPVMVDTVTGVTIDLQAGSDTGSSSTDNITADNTPRFDVTVAEAGLIEVDYDGD